MKTSKLLGALLPSSPDFAPTIDAIREKYNLPEINPDDDPIKGIYLGENILPLKEFRRDIEILIRKNLAFMPPDTVKLYTATRTISAITEIKELEILPPDIKIAMEAFSKFAKNMMQPVVQLLDVQIDCVVDMIYVYLLTGQTKEAPSDWFGKVVTLPIYGRTDNYCNSESNYKS